MAVPHSYEVDAAAAPSAAASQTVHQPAETKTSRNGPVAA